MHRFLPCLLALLTWGPALHAETPFQFDTTPGKLPKDIVPVQYDLTFAPDIEKRTFSGQESVEITVKQPTARCVINAQDLEICEVEIAPSGQWNEAPFATATVKPTVSLDADAQTCTLTFPAPLPAGNYRLSLRFSGKINQDGAGLFASTYNADGKPETMLCTQMEPTDARRMFPCWDEPAFRAKFHLMVDKVPTGLTAVSNMPVSGVYGFAEGEETWGFQTTPPMASYLVVLAIGNFDTIEGESDGTKIRVVTAKGRVQNGKYALESAEKILHYYNEYFGVKFPLPKLDLIAVSGGASFGGAMENWGGIVFAEPRLLYDPATTSQSAKEDIFEVIAHEMAHQWFGDLVTMGWWDNLWLNEGFAEWMGEAATDHFNPSWEYWHNIFANKNHAMVSDARSTTHPIQQPVVSEMDAERAFDEITYNKGQSFIRMLERYLGPDKFRDGLRRYMKAHAYGNTTTADLWASLAEGSDKPITSIAAQWTEQPGFPLVSMTRDAEHPDKVKLSQRRFTVHDPHAAPLRWKIPMTYSLHGGDVGLAGSFLLDDDVTEPDPQDQDNHYVKYNDHGTGYYRVQYDEATLRPLLAHLNDLPAPDQANLLSDAWAAVRANLGPVTSFLGIVQALRPEGTNPLVWTEVCAVAGTIDGLYVGGDAKERTAWRQAMIAVLRPVFEHYGWQPAPEEAAPVKNLRSVLIAQLGYLDDDLTVGACKERFAAFLKDSSALPPDIRAAVCNVVGRHADAATYDSLLSLARKASSDEQRHLFYHALAHAADLKLSQKTLELTAGDELQGSLAFRLIVEVASGGEQPEAAVKYTLEHLDPLMKKVSPMAKNLVVPNLYQSFSDAARADELETYAVKIGAVADPVQVKKSAESIRSDADLKARLLPAIRLWATGLSNH